jgi:hypothetical protein
MNYKNYPISLALSFTLIATILSIAGAKDFRIYILMFTVASILNEIAFYPFPRPSNYIISGITLIWIIASLYYILGIIGIV